MSGLTPEGFVGKRLPAIKSETEAALVAGLGPLNFNSETVIGQLVGLNADAQARFWQLLEDVYQSQYPSGAVGVNLDRVVAINGLVRLGALPTTVRAVVTGVAGTTIPPASIAKNSNTDEFYRALSGRTLSLATSVGALIEVATVADDADYTVTLDGTPVTIDSGTDATAATILAALASALSVETELGVDSLRLDYDTPRSISVSANLTIVEVSAFLDFESVVRGPIDLPAGRLDAIETPIAGWTAVTNREPGVTGRAIETDDELRVRRERSVRVAATNTLDGIQANLAFLDGVTNVLVRENNTNITDPDGVPPNHVWAIVQGGEAAAIGRVLYDRVAAGIGTFGTEEEVVTSELSGQSYVMRFDRPDIVTVQIRVVVAGGPLLPADFAERIRAALVQFGAGLSIGQDVLFTRLYCPIQTAIDAGSYVEELYLDVVAPAAGTSNLAIGNQELAVIAAENIVVSSV